MDKMVESRSVSIRNNLLSWRTLTGFAVAAAVIYLFLHNFNLGAAIGSISRAHWYFFLAALAVHYLSLPLRGGRWGVLLKSSGYSIEFRKLNLFYFLSWFANALLPARIGDLYKAYLLRRSDGVPISLSLGVVFSERVFDLLATAGLVMISGVYYWRALKGSSEGNLLLLGLLAVMLIVVLFIALSAGLPRLVRFAPEKWRERLELFRGGLFRFKSFLPTVAIMTLSIWLCESFRLYLVFKAFDLEAGFLSALFISQAALIIMAVPISPAGLGLVELLMLKILTSMGIVTDLAGAVTLADRMISYWSLLLLGSITYLFGTGER